MSLLVRFTDKRKDSHKMSMEMQSVPNRITIFNEQSASHEERIAWYHHMQKTQSLRYRPE